MKDINLNGIEGVSYALRKLFSSYGYNEYKMTKFEEYDLYVKNKGFLISDSVITFTDTNGKLLALKPDVTLSIVKNTKITADITKVFYNEKVYRITSHGGGYKEIAQIGIECLGDIEELNVAEMLTLAAESLKTISTAVVLNITPIGLTSSCIDQLNLDGVTKTAVIKCINEKNAHELSSILAGTACAQQDVDRLVKLLGVYGSIDTALATLKSLFADTALCDEVSAFANTLGILPEDTRRIINVDCSSCENLKYYNSITFKGYVNGIPKEILSGGRYDGLLKKMGKSGKALGFAIYPDELDRMFAVDKQYDVDVVVQYSDSSSKADVLSKVQALVQDGYSATAVKSIPAGLKYKDIIIM